MEQAPPQVAHELQLNQLPEGTEIQVRPVPLAFAYKRLGGQWIPIESDPTAYEPVIGDVFPLGTIAIDPEGIAYVKGFAGCPWHPLSAPCLCMKQVCWLRAGRVRAPGPHPPPGDAAAQQAEPNEDIAMGVVVPVQDFQSNVPHAEPDMPNMEDGLDGHHPSPYLPAPRGYGQSTGNGDFGPYEVSGVDGPPFAAPGGSEEVHHMFNELQMADEEGMQPPSQPAPVNHAVDNELQEVRHADLGSDSCTIYFDQQGDGIPLTAVNTLDRELLAFEQDVSLNIKASIRFKFRYWQDIPDLREHVDRRKQVNIRHGRKDGPPISLRAMARLVLSELTAEMKTMADLSYPLRHDGLPVRIEELVLVRIERIKFGTLQPVFVLRR